MPPPANSTSKRKHRTWQAELDQHPLLKELRRRVSARREALVEDKEYLYESSKLDKAIRRALKSNPKTMRRFFDRFSDPFSRLAEARAFVKNIRKENLESLFLRYIKYVGRFGVAIRLTKSRIPIVREILPPLGSTFHVEIERDGIAPIVFNSLGDVPDEYLFESRFLKLTKTLQRHIKSGTAKLVKIEDDLWSSHLSQLERFAYYPEGITFVVHNAALPYLLCIAGEDVSAADWRGAYPIFKELRKTYYGREKAGRPPDLRWQREAIRSFTESGQDKAKAIERSSTDNPGSSIVRYSKLKGRLASK